MTHRRMGDKATARGQQLSGDCVAIVLTGVGKALWKRRLTFVLLFFFFFLEKLLSPAGIKPNVKADCVR